jgi:hypothetical protein
VNYRITPHSGYNAPPDALDRLFELLGPRRGDFTFSKSSDAEIAAVWSADVPSTTAQDELVETGRCALLDLVREECELTPSLDIDWYAFSPKPDSPERVRSW